MFEIKDKVEDIAENIEEIAKTYYRISVVNITDKVSKLGASLLISLFLFIVLLFALFFGCLGLSWWIGEQLNSQVSGFFIVAGGLLVILLLIVLLRKNIINFIRNIIINKMYD
ncbi:phage holin family protein [Niabella aquatica]